MTTDDQKRLEEIEETLQQCDELSASETIDLLRIAKSALTKLEAAKEYVDFLEEFWGIDYRVHNNPKTQTARAKYLEAMKGKDAHEKG